MRPWRWLDAGAARVGVSDTSTFRKMGQKLVGKNTPGKLQRLKLEVQFYI